MVFCSFFLHYKLSAISILHF
uniref:Uncharacterized protein n=1 Tax=Amphimedon queenslandica TaxID=400682 RepID=A0A1X7V6Z8_AMPQE